MRPGAGAGAGAGDLPLAGPDPTPRSCAGLQPGDGAGDAALGPAAVSVDYLPLPHYNTHITHPSTANLHLSLAEIKRVGVGQRTVRAAVTATKLRPSIFNRRNLHKYLCLVKDECLGRY